ncbi:Pho81 protein [Saccharomycopsis crataegensis]|uniref:Pho81 protein n=1 Tax=Saccharomycopsis crataegensis TaxID=43959 RepID=A0AAV5QIH5_9ASCO|nr:Pho81 protein [Saccharomycopsis crataegensis]
MKFGKYLESKQLELPEYLGHFINYKGLKKLIKQLATIDDNNGNVKIKIDFVNNPEIQKILQDNKSTFFFRVERELDKVNEFYLEKQADLKLKLEILVTKKLQLLKKHSSQLLLESNESNPNAKKKSSITFQTLYANFKQFSVKIDELSQFVELNETGFRKILKKWDKRSQSHLQELYLSTTVNVQPVFHREEINHLNDLVGNSITELEAFADGENVVIQNSSTIPHRTLEFEPSENTIIEDEDHQTDEMYSKFLNIATAPNNQLILLSNWLNKLKGFENSERLTKIFFLSITAPIEDVYLLNFYNFFKKYIDLKFVDDYTNKNFLHQIATGLFPDHDDQSSSKLNDVNCRANSIIQLSKIDESISSKQREEPQPQSQPQIDQNSKVSKFTRYFLVKYLLLDDASNEFIDLLSMKDNNSKIPLHYASQFGEFELSKLLVEKCPESIYLLDNHTMSPLLLSIKNNHLDCVSYLLNKQNELHLSNITPSSSEKSADTMNAQIPPLIYGCKKGNPEIIRTLLSFPSIIDTTTPNVEGLLPLHMAARFGHHQIIELLITEGHCDPNGVCSLNHWSPIFYSAYHGHARTTKQLIKFGAVPDISDDENCTPIYYAALKGHVNVLNVLFHSAGMMNLNTPFPLTTSNLSKANLNTIKSPILGEVAIENPMGNIGNNKNSIEILTPTTINNLFKTLPQKKSPPSNILNSTSNSIPSTNSNPAMSQPMNHNPNSNINLDSIPNFSLPPPIIPLRKYGHNFLEKKTSLQIFFLPGKASIKMFNRAGHGAHSTSHINNNSIQQRMNSFQNNSGIQEFEDVNEEDDDEDDDHIFNDDEDSYDNVNRPLFPGRITIASSSLDVVPRNLLLPINDKENSVTFQLDLDDLPENFSIGFELYPTFGTRLIAKTTALADVFLGKAVIDGEGTVTLPLFDSRVKTVGELTFSFQIISAYCGTPLEITKYETYWKSTKDDEDVNPTVSNNDTGHHMASILSFVAEFSLSGDYLKLNLVMLGDGTPVVVPSSFVRIGGIKLSLMTLSYEELLAIVSSDNSIDDIKNQLITLQQEFKSDPELASGSCLMKKKNFIKKVHSLLSKLYLPLDIVLQTLPIEISVNLDIFYPTKFELEHFFKMISVNNNSDFPGRYGTRGAEPTGLNSFVDRILTHVFNHMRTCKAAKRSIVFSSYNPQVCKVLNWKQPNFPVFFAMGGTGFDYSTNSFELRSANGFTITKNSILNQLHRSVGSGVAINNIHSLGSTTVSSSGTGVNLIKNIENPCTRSIDQAIGFASANNLMGVILPIKLLHCIPDLSNTIRSRGLILVGTKEDPKKFSNHFFEKAKPFQESMDDHKTETKESKGVFDTLKDFEDIEIKDYSTSNDGNLNGVRINSVLEFRGSIDM